MKCTFCGVEIKEATGLIYAKKDGTTYNFCSSKCKKSLLDKKFKPHKTRWTEKFHIEKKRHLKNLEKK